MKKFKHRKTGEIATYKDGVLKSSGFAIELGVEPSQEFWEEIVEKEYEILSYIQIISNRVYKKDKDGIFVSDNMWSLSVPLESHFNIKIHSVKRLSDGEIFTVGDKYNWKSNKNQTNIIRQILLKDNKILIHDSKYISEEYDADLDQIEKIKQPLFTTEDGVDIFDGDEYTFVRYDYSIKTSIAARNHNSSKLSNDYLGDFSTKEKAEEYILMNKPCLSLNDVCNLLPRIQRERLIQLVKSKL